MTVAAGPLHSAHSRASGNPAGERVVLTETGSPPPRERAEDKARPCLRLVLIAGCLVCFSALSAVTAWWITALGPAPLGRDIALSTRVLDRDDRLLRAYATAEGRWRLDRLGGQRRAAGDAGLAVALDAKLEPRRALGRGHDGDVTIINRLQKAALGATAVEPVAAPIGGVGERVTTRRELASALDRAVKRRGQFSLVEVMLPRGVTSDTLARFVSGFKSVRGRMAKA